MTPRSNDITDEEILDCLPYGVEEAKRVRKPKSAMYDYIIERLDWKNEWGEAVHHKTVRCRFREIPEGFWDIWKAKGKRDQGEFGSREEYLYRIIQEEGGENAEEEVTGEGDPGEPGEAVEAESEVEAEEDVLEVMEDTVQPLRTELTDEEIQFIKQAIRDIKDHIKDRKDPEEIISQINQKVKSGSPLYKSKELIKCAWDLLEIMKGLEHTIHSALPLFLNLHESAGKHNDTLWLMDNVDEDLWRFIKDKKRIDFYWIAIIALIEEGNLKECISRIKRLFDAYYRDKEIPREFLIKVVKEMVRYYHDKENTTGKNPWMKILKKHIHREEDMQYVLQWAHECCYVGEGKFSDENYEHLDYWWRYKTITPIDLSDDDKKEAQEFMKNL